MANTSLDGSPRSPSLSGKLSEFRDALLAEIEACKNASNNIRLGDIFPRAANAAANVFGGATEAAHERVVLTQSHFYGLLCTDLANAQQRVVIFSAFITQSRLEMLAPHLQTAIQRGVRVYVVTKTIEERSRQEQNGYKWLEEALKKWKISVLHKRGMHEKLIFIDSSVLWSGSLSPLSFSNTQEHMERRKSRQVVEDYAKTIWLNELIQEFESHCQTCPCCGGEVVATEGRDVPFYWRCVRKDCYSRSVGDSGVIDGVDLCHTCQNPVDFHMPNDTPFWRCTANRRHRRKLRRIGLMLSKMRKLIPKSALRDLDRRYRTSDPTAKRPRATQTDVQQSLPLDETGPPMAQNGS